jgi:hypothetical protein
LFALFAAAAPLLKTEYWAGRSTLTLKFEVLDARSDHPVPDAAITIFYGVAERGVGVPPPEPDDSDPSTQRFSSNAVGKVEAQHSFFAYGHSSWLTDFGRVRFWDRFIRVTAPRYDPIQFALRDALGDERGHHDKSPIVLPVKLEPARDSR